MKLHQGQSYLWLFAVFVVPFIALLVASDRIEVAADLAAFILPLMTGFVFVSELRSGLVLDSWWRATYPKGTWQYNAGVLARAIVTIVFARKTKGSERIVKIVLTPLFVFV